MDEIKAIKNKNIWIAYDRLGNKATGVTKDIAINNWYLKFGVNFPTIADINKIEKVELNVED